MIRPLDNRILVRPVPQAKPVSSLFIPDDKTTFAYGNSGRPTVAKTRGVVVSVGPGRVTKKGIRVPVEAQIGDVVNFSDSCGRPCKMNGEELLFIREDDIAFIEE